MYDPNEFVEAADHILNTVVATYAEHGVELPERRYLAVGGQGDTVHDCEQLTVSFEQGYSGLPGSQAQEPVKCDGPRTAVFIVEVVRALPLPNTPAANPTTPIAARYSKEKTGVAVLPAEVQSEIARKQMKDAMLLLEAGLQAGQATLINGSLADVTAGSPQGGFQAMSLVITVAAAMQDQNPG
jgi:hypothetical protein